MAMVKWCGAVARRVLAREQRALFKTSSSSSVSAQNSGIGAPILCGQGDNKTKKGKRFKGSNRNTQPKNEKMIERIKDKVEVLRSTLWPLPFKLV